MRCTRALRLCAGLTLGAVCDSRVGRGLVLVAIVILSSARCSPGSGHKAKTEPPKAEERADTANALPPLERARLEYLFAAERLVAKAWPFPTNEEICVLLLSPTMQWLVNCDEAPAKTFTRLALDFRGRPVYARPGGKFEADGRELSTRELLATVSAAAHVDEPGAQRSDFSPHHPWLLLGSLDALRQYHPAFPECSTEEWLSVALHEFLHARALRTSSFAASLHRINSKEAEPKSLVRVYQSDARYRALVEREYALLVTAAENPGLDMAQAQRAIEAWHRLYRTRVVALGARPDGAALVQSDRLFTYVEGLARYVESTFLVDAVQHPNGIIAGDPLFHRFEKWEGRGYTAMPNRQLDPEYYYAIGFHLALLLDRIDPSWKQRVSTHPSWLIGIAEEVAALGAQAPLKNPR